MRFFLSPFFNLQFKDLIEKKIKTTLGFPRSVQTKIAFTADVKPW